ncbi:MAG: hypothetical protein E7166_06050 [Firmicutes bacterium]|nr:hypothetical protein [Bacillota bacterium]
MILSNEVIISGKLEKILFHPDVKKRCKLFISQSLNKGKINKDDELRNVFIIIIDLNNLKEKELLKKDSYIKIIGEIESIHDLYMNGAEDEFAIRPKVIERIEI